MIDLRSYTNGCANCLSLDTVKSDSIQSVLKRKTIGASEDVKVRDALSLIYHLKFVLTENENQDLELCENCGEILFQLHHLYTHFKNLCRASSHIHNARGQLLSNGPLDPPSLIVNDSVTVTDVACQYESEMSQDQPKPLESADKWTLTEEKWFKNKGLRSKLREISTEYNGFVPGLKIKEEAEKEDREYDIEDNDDWIPPPSVEYHDKAADSPQFVKKRRGRPRGSRTKQLVFVQKQVKSHVPKEIANSTNSRALRRPSRKKFDVPDIPEPSLSEEVQRQPDKTLQPAVKRGRGRPRKTQMHQEPIGVVDQAEVISAKADPEIVGVRSLDSCFIDPSSVVKVEHSLKRKRGRPRKDYNDLKDPVVVTERNGRKRRRHRRSIVVVIEDGDDDKSGESNAKRPRGRPRGSKNTGQTLTSRFECDQCGKMAGSYRNLQVHIRGVHQGLRPYPCPVCKKQFSSKTGMENHCHVIHGEGGPARKYTCPEPGCGKTFAYSAGLYVHGYTHARELPVPCPECGKKCRSNFDMKRHLTTHTSDKPFICEHCGTTVKTQLTLRKHIRFMHRDIIGGPPAPSCSICHKVFQTPGNMRAHVRAVHNQEKRYTCDLCGKQFSCTSNLKVHLRGYHKQDFEAPGRAGNTESEPTSSFSHSHTDRIEQSVEVPNNTIIQIQRNPMLHPLHPSERTQFLLHNQNHQELVPPQFTYFHEFMSGI